MLKISSSEYEGETIVDIVTDEFSIEDDCSVTDLTGEQLEILAAIYIDKSRSLITLSVEIHPYFRKKDKLKEDHKCKRVLKSIYFKNL